MSARALHCPSRFCGCKTSHVLIWEVHEAIGGSLHGWTCENCGWQRIGNNVRISMPNEDETRWATAEELATARKARNAAYKPATAELVEA